MQVIFYQEPISATKAQRSVKLPCIANFNCCRTPLCACYLLRIVTNDISGVVTRFPEKIYYRYYCLIWRLMVALWWKSTRLRKREIQFVCRKLLCIDLEIMEAFVTRHVDEVECHALVHLFTSFPGRWSLVNRQQSLTSDSIRSARSH